VLYLLTSSFHHLAGEVMEELCIDSNNLTVDMLGVQADMAIFQRFDRFNEKYNVIGKPFALRYHRAIQ